MSNINNRNFSTTLDTHVFNRVNNQFNKNMDYYIQSELVKQKERILTKYYFQIKTLPCEYLPGLTLEQKEEKERKVFYNSQPQCI